MKKGIEVWPDWDITGRWILNIRKKRGKLTLDEIREAAMEYEQDLYLLPLNCMPDTWFDGWDGGDDEGDAVQLYRSDALRREAEDAAGI